MRTALLCQLAGLLRLAFAGSSTLLVGAALACFFVGLNFLEAALPARLSVLADEAQRGASLGVFSSAQFLGAFAGGLAAAGSCPRAVPRTYSWRRRRSPACWLVFHQIDFGRNNAAESTEI